MKIAFIVLYLVVTIAMIAFIMLQRGSGAAAGSGFGSGASGTVFGARGSANFLSKATKWLAVAFFLLAMAMAVYEARVGIARDAKAELGVMGQLPTATTPTNSEVPAAAEGNPASDVPTATTGEAPAADSSVPSEATAVDISTPNAGPAEQAPASETPASQTMETPAADASKGEEKPQ